MHRPETRYIIVLVVLMLLSGLWLARVTVAEFALITVLRNAGMQDISADIQQLDPDHTKLARLGFSLDNDAGLLELESQALDIDYSFGQLISGRIESLIINRLVVHFTPALGAQAQSSTTATVVQPAQVLAVIRQGLREYAFANHVSVHTLVLHGELFGALQDTPLELDVMDDAGSLQASVTTLQPSPATDRSQRQLAITQFTADSLAAELRFPATAGSSVAGIRIDFPDTDNHETTIAGSYQLDPQKLQHWLDPARPLNTRTTTDTINGAFAVDFKHTDAISTRLSASSNRITAGTYSEDKAEIHLSGIYSNTESLHRLSLDKSSYVTFNKFNYDTISLAPGKIYMSGELLASASEQNYKGIIHTDTLTLNLPEQTLRLKQLSTHILANNQHVSLDGSFAPAKLPGKFSFTAKHNLITAAGTLVMDPQTPININADTHKLSQLLSPWPWPFDLLAGALNLSARAHWSQKNDFTLSTRIKLDDAGGTMGELLFSGLSFDHELGIQPSLRSLRPTQFNLKHVDSGVTASNISTQLRLKTPGKQLLPEIEIQNLRGEIFDGQFTAEDFIYDLNAATNRLKINATNIDLAKIVETQQLEDITVTGRIDGSIPVKINAQGVSIEHGAFINDVRAGTIRYNPAAGTEQLKQNPITGMTLDALRDFRYSELSAGVDFTPEGVLTIDLRLKGTSPELDTKRPVHLNINTEQNLLSLLKSLRYAKGVSDAIDAKVRRQYEKTKQ
ncbi:MAG: YdbH domain-containing protein [Gammaproteobacteria bacterium]